MIPKKYPGWNWNLTLPTNEDGWGWQLTCPALGCAISLAKGSETEFYTYGNVPESELPVLKELILKANKEFPWKWRKASPDAAALGWFLIAQKAGQLHMVTIRSDLKFYFNPTSTKKLTGEEKRWVRETLLWVNRAAMGLHDLALEGE